MRSCLLTDTLVSALRVSRETWKALAETWAARSDTAVPLTTSSITPDWLTEALQCRRPGVRVLETTCLSEIHGTTTHAKIGLSYEQAGEDHGLPDTMFVKLTPHDLKTRVFVSLFNLASSETRFYEEISGEIRDHVPRFFLARSSLRGGRFVVLLEDLEAGGFYTKDTTNPCALDEAKTVVTTLAAIHGQFWESPRLTEELAWLPTYETDKNVRLNRLLRKFSLKRTLSRFGDLIPGPVKVSAPLINDGYDALEAYWATPPQTLIHGDAHVGNMYFDNKKAGLLDWQVVRRGQGMRDVSYFMVHSLTTEMRRDHEKELIMLYLDSLKSVGVQQLDFETAWFQHRTHALYSWIAVLVTAAAATFQKEAVVRASLERCAAAMVDLDSVGALRFLIRES